MLIVFQVWRQIHRTDRRFTCLHFSFFIFQVLIQFFYLTH